MAAQGHDMSCRCAGCTGAAATYDIRADEIMAPDHKGFFSGFGAFFGRLFGLEPRRFMPEMDLAKIPGVDPRLVPRAPMSSDGIDAGTLAALSNEFGLRHGRLITSQSHPELYAAWQTLSARAGMPQAPQLILADSPAINAMTVSPEEVVVTTGLFQLLNLREVMGVLSHELGHERYGNSHNNTRNWAHIGFMGAGAVSGNLVGNAWDRNAKAHPHPLKPSPGLLGYWALVLGGGAAGDIVGRQVSVKPTELQADLEGAAISGDPGALISAYEKLDAVIKATPKPRNPIEAWRKTAHFRSGYPTMRERINHLKDTLANMPAPNLPPPVVTQAEPSPTQPAAQVSGVTVAERVFYSPEAGNSIVH